MTMTLIGYLPAKSEAIETKGTRTEELPPKLVGVQPEYLLPVQLPGPV